MISQINGGKITIQPQIVLEIVMNYIKTAGAIAILFIAGGCTSHLDAFQDRKRLVFEAPKPRETVEIAREATTNLLTDYQNMANAYEADQSLFNAGYALTALWAAASTAFSAHPDYLIASALTGGTLTTLNNNLSPDKTREALEAGSVKLACVGEKSIPLIQLDPVDSSHGSNGSKNTGLKYMSSSVLQNGTGISPFSDLAIEVSQLRTDPTFLKKNGLVAGSSPFLNFANGAVSTAPSRKVAVETIISTTMTIHLNTMKELRAVRVDWKTLAENYSKAASTAGDKQKKIDSGAEAIKKMMGTAPTVFSALEVKTKELVDAIAELKKCAI